ncbi:hypothetical protein TREAZ_2448 [Leadbettera azotonutricia ZAS-9]|uniref:Uncharacterized protein n=1 Tax=Leadbettera azotonutricia (strain ATCC BAA-888 / DSM 13862 / ZAS-9) TaxID=545695 RepID=F5YFS0_LEAAZ|nr:hypothetical protein [Leadbettera azotonutricia]AEF80281.1 hypothetical protein TREAZ_2448 [Leadbettera azotonutricia ZAS-9]
METSLLDSTLIKKLWLSVRKFSGKIILRLPLAITKSAVIIQSSATKKAEEFHLKADSA